jgi:calcineurin-like phosphoesterase family protein
MATWFTADFHFCHQNIIRLCDRPCADVQAMNRHLIAAVQARVEPNDDLWILGDFAMGRASPETRAEVASIFGVLPGRKHLVIGNHEAGWTRALAWSSQSQMADIVVDGRRLIMSHYPMMTFAGSRYGAVQLFGHVHQNWLGSRNSINVGVDVWDFAPVRLEQIVARAATLPVNPLWSTVEPCAELE